MLSPALLCRIQVTQNSFFTSVAQVSAYGIGALSSRCPHRIADPYGPTLAGAAHRGYLRPNQGPPASAAQLPLPEAAYPGPPPPQGRRRRGHSGSALRCFLLAAEIPTPPGYLTGCDLRETVPFPAHPIARVPSVQLGIFIPQPSCRWRYLPGLLRLDLATNQVALTGDREISLTAPRFGRSCDCPSCGRCVPDRPA